MRVTIEQIVEYVASTFEHVSDDRHWGERALFYNPGQRLPKGIYFLTFKERDGAHDNASRIGPGEFRLNVGIPKQAFVARFGPLPPRPMAGRVVESGHDFSREDVVTPHPVYGWMSWIAVKNPSQATFDEVKPLLAEAYLSAMAKFRKRVK